MKCTASCKRQIMKTTNEPKLQQLMIQIASFVSNPIDDCKQCVNENHQNNQQSSFHQTNLCHSQAVTWLITCCMCVNIQWNSGKKKTSSLWSRQKPQMPGCTRQVNHQQWQQHRTAREGVHTGNRRCEASLAVWEQIKDKTQVFFHLPSETTHTPT